MSRYVMPWNGKGLKYRKEIPSECLTEIWDKYSYADSKLRGKSNPYRMLKENFIGHNWVSYCNDVPLMHASGKTHYVKFRGIFYIVQGGSRYLVTPAVRKIVEKYINED